VSVLVIVFMPGREAAIVSVAPVFLAFMKYRSETSTGSSDVVAAAASIGGA